jgi:tetratricopeptide (TPR) repeat protein
LYKELIAVVDKGSKEELGAPINRVKMRLGAAAALLADKNYDAAIVRLQEAQGVLEAAGQLRPRDHFLGRSLFDQHRPDQKAYSLLLTGLLAQAARGKGDFALARQALQKRKELLVLRLEADDQDDDLVELARACAQLGEITYRQGKLENARQHFQAGLDFVDRFKKRTNTPVHEAELRLVQALCELHLYGKLALSNKGMNLKQRLQQVYAAICDNPSPSWQAERFLFGTYLTWIELNG